MSSFEGKTFFEKTTPTVELVVVTKVTSLVCVEFSYRLLYSFLYRNDVVLIVVVTVVCSVVITYYL